MQSNFQNLVYLLQAAEKILFSFKVSDEISQKYEVLRKKTFEKCGLEYVPIERLSRDKKSFEAKTVQTDFGEDSERLTEFVKVNLTITSSILEKVEKIKEVLVMINGEKTDGNCASVEVQTSREENLQETLKYLLAHQIVLIEASCLNVLEQLEGVYSKISSLRLTLVSKEDHYQSTLNDKFEEFQERESSLIENLESFKSSWKAERSKLIEQHTSLENILDLQEKQIEAQYREIHELQAIVDQKTQESETVKKVLQDEVIFANDQKFQIIDELKQKHEKELQAFKQNNHKLISETLNQNQKVIENLEKSKIQLESKVKTLEQTIIQDRENFLKESESKESQFFIHLESMNEKIMERNSKIQELEKNLTKVLDSKHEVYREVSAIMTFFNEKQEIASNEEEESFIMLRSLACMKKLVERLRVENNWLVDKLKSFEESNKSLRISLSSAMSTEIMKDSAKCSEVFNDFEKSRVNFRNYLRNKED